MKLLSRRHNSTDGYLSAMPVSSIYGATLQHARALDNGIHDALKKDLQLGPGFPLELKRENSLLHDLGIKVLEPFIDL